jgi:hypothetical protein
MFIKISQWLVEVEKKDNMKCANPITEAAYTPDRMHIAQI